MKKKKETVPSDSSTGAVFAADEKIVSDPFGSYTGITPVPGEKPVQDADDL